jgi:hypothetical protein
VVVLLCPAAELMAWWEDANAPVGEGIRSVRVCGVNHLIRVVPLEVGAFQVHPALPAGLMVVPPAARRRLGLVVGPGPRLVHMPSEPSGSQRSLVVPLGAGRRWDSGGYEAGCRTLIRMGSGGGLGGCLEDVRRDNHGHERSTAVQLQSRDEQGKRCDQYRFSARSLDGMQGVRTNSTAVCWTAATD